MQNKKIILKTYGVADLLVLNDGVEQPLVADAGILDLLQETVQVQLVILF